MNSIFRRHSSRLRRTTLLAAAFAAAFAGTSVASAAQTINLPNNDSPTWGLGKGASTTIGQTFVAPTGFNYLQSFSFWLSDDSGLGATNPGSLLFQAYVMQWDAANGHATGPVLFSSNARSGPAALSQRYDFAATNTFLDPNLQYVAFLSASQQLGNIFVSDANAVVESSFQGTYTGGQLVFDSNDSDFASLTSDTWDFTGFPEYQAHFEAAFTDAAVSVVPEPSSLVLLVTGLSVVLFVALKRKRV